MFKLKKKNKKHPAVEPVAKEEVEIVDESPQEQELSQTANEEDLADDVDNNELDDEAEDDELLEEGQLSVDVYQDKHNIIIKSTIAGVEPEDIDITFDNGMLTIRGKRQKDLTVDEENYFYQECYWGSFSRSIILPVPVAADKIKATIKNGVLTIRIPKSHKDVSIKVEEED